MVRRLVARMFGRFPSCDINPDEVVALGAAVQAGLKARDAALDEVVMTDVAPYSLGVDTSMRLGQDVYSHGHFDPIIERNSVVPVSRVKRYYPLKENQQQLVLNVFQGEARMASDNIKLGSLQLNLPGGRQEDAGVDVRFTYDVNGLLQVEATIVKTQQQNTLLIEGNPGMLSEQEIAQRFAALSALKIHPRDQMENRTLLARGERLYQQLRGRVNTWVCRSRALSRRWKPKTRNSSARPPRPSANCWMHWRARASCPTTRTEHHARHHAVPGTPGPGYRNRRPRHPPRLCTRAQAHRPGAGWRRIPGIARSL
jgi:molecular chaperone DnaK (HSP70)